MKKKRNPQIVVAAVIENAGRVLIGRRKVGKQHAGKWEFPGGTLEEGESREECLKRELSEELGIVVEVEKQLCTCSHTYTPEWTIQLEAYFVTVIGGTFVLQDHDKLMWVHPEELSDFDFTETDRAVIEVLRNSGN
ncbi:MAG TPA: (deoxy)nucleoside triphosphate pyrophosphohydrolase [Syntrophorhabdaceae bacterium]|nr:(deoxy)nucleoside triphosphate pyrophosphohydrolase [Syntrophorhabdaceae bacterium]